MKKVLELSNRKSKGGRRRIEIVLHKIPSDESEVNRNGIHWSEKNTLANIETVKGIPICAEFSDSDKETPLGHGYTSTEIIDGKKTPVFENSEVVGYIDHGEIRDITVGDESIRALVGSGYLYEQRYPNFVQWVRNNVETSSVDTSVEIVGYEENDNQIVYEAGECSESYRCPKDYQYSGTAIISVLPADSNAIVLECAEANNQDKEDTYAMTEQEIMDVIKGALNETNTLKEAHQTEVDALNSTIAERDTTISELNATVEQVQQALKDMEAERDAWYAERAELEKTLGELKAKERLGELNEALAVYSEDEQKFAEVEINAFKENPVEGDLDAIKNKINAAIVEKRNEDAKIAEQNAAKQKENEKVEDIFSEVNSFSDENKEEDTNIF